jgi:integrase
VRKDFYLFKRGKVWYAQFALPGGKLSVARSTGETNETRAEKWARGKLPDIGKPQTPLKEWAGRFFTSDCPHASRLRIEGRSYGEEHRIHSSKLLAAHILPDPICLIPMENIRKADIFAFRERLVKSNGLNRTSQMVMATLRVIMREALFRELVDKDCFVGIGQLHYQPKPRTALTDAEMRLVLDPAKYADPMHYEATCCAAYTGMRAGEILALTWGAIANGRIHITQSIPANATEVQDPKWHKKRFCPYPSSLSKILEPRRGEPGQYVFHRQNRHMGYKHWAEAIGKAAKGVHLHLLRHTLNTRLLEQGVPEEIVRGWLGWSSAEAQGLYTHRDEYNYANFGGHVDSIMDRLKIGGTNESN